MSIVLVLAAAAAPAADDRAGPRMSDQTVACVPAQVIVPPFNNTAEAMEQSRVAATEVMRERARAGDRAIAVCRTSAVAPLISQVEGVDEIPIDPAVEPDQAVVEPSGT